MKLILLFRGANLRKKSIGMRILNITMCYNAYLSASKSTLSRELRFQSYKVSFLTS